MRYRLSPQDIIREEPTAEGRTKEELTEEELTKEELTKEELTKEELTKEEQECWQRDGFFIRESVFSPAELETLRSAARLAEKTAQELSNQGDTYFLDGKRFVDIGSLTVQFEHEAPDCERVRVIEPVHEIVPRYDELVDDPRLAVPMQGLIGQADLSLWTAKLNMKPGKIGSGFGWHQDSPYWVHDCEHVDLLPNVMLTFDDATEENGCFQVIRGSHKQGCLPGTDNGTQLGGFFTDPGCFTEADAVPMVVPAGSLIFFSAHSIHGSGVNQTESARRAIILTYQPGGHRTLKSRSLRPISNGVAA